MDSKVVNSQHQGGNLASRKALITSQPYCWRHHHDRIDVVNFQSFNSYQAAVIGCTTYSFGVNLGCYLLSIPYPIWAVHIKGKSGQLLPDESQCHIRGRFHHPLKSARSLCALIKIEKPLKTSGAVGKVEQSHRHCRVQRMLLIQGNAMGSDGL